MIKLRELKIPQHMDFQNNIKEFGKNVDRITKNS
jgi:hypothetical protein